MSASAPLSGMVQQTSCTSFELCWNHGSTAVFCVELQQCQPVLCGMVDMRQCPWTPVSGRCEVLDPQYNPVLMVSLAGPNSRSDTSICVSAPSEGKRAFYQHAGARSDRCGRQRREQQGARWRRNFAYLSAWPWPTRRRWLQKAVAGARSRPEHGLRFRCGRLGQFLDCGQCSPPAAPPATLPIDNPHGAWAADSEEICSDLLADSLNEQCESGPTLAAAKRM